MTAVSRRAPADPPPAPGVRRRSPAPVPPRRAPPSAPAPASIPRFALYGEDGTPGPEMMHIEEVRSRSSLYHWEIQPHVHKGLYQVLWLHRGAATVALDEAQEKVQGPAAIVVPPGVVHGFRFQPDTDGLVLTLSARFLVEGDFQSVGEAFSTLFHAPGVLQFAPADVAVARLDTLLRELAAEFAQPLAASSPVLAWLARAWVWRLAQAGASLRPVQSAAGAAGRPTKGGGSDKAHHHQALFTRFQMLVEQHYAEHWPLERYASRLGLSVPRLNRLVQAERGHSALELIHERLTREACRRLVYIAVPAANLATELGFADPAYFSRFFKRRTGHSPHRYRVLHRQAPDAG